MSHIGGAAARATVTLASGSYDAGSGKCSTSCHGAGLSPAWSTTGLQCGACHGIPPATTVHAGKTIADCSNCHSETMTNGSLIPGGKHIDGIVQKSGGHSDYTSPTVHGPKFFGFIAGEGGECRNCHGATDDGGFGPSCNDCHEGQSWTAWQTNCSFCHGVKTPQSQLGGYNLALNPMWSAPATGAHQAHLVGGRFAEGFKCETCHEVPLDLEHIGGSAARASVALNAAGQASLPAALGDYHPSASAADATCTTYCHGAAAPSPAWSTIGLQCGACHGLAPATPSHPSVSSQLTGCATCHPDTVNGDGTLHLSGGAHIDGQVQVERYHAAGYRDPAVHGPDFLAYAATAQPEASGCKSCHGVTYAGGRGSSCNTCHADAGWASWQTNCSFCHGASTAASKSGYDVALNPSWAAPPATTSVLVLERTQAQRIGAHQAHLTGRTANGELLSGPIPCSTCHAVPADLSHIGNTRATVTLAGYDPASGSCTTACHGVGLTATYDPPKPTWNQRFTVGDCAQCHLYPPEPGREVANPWYPDPGEPPTFFLHEDSHTGSCNRCHPAQSSSRHVNGVVDFEDITYDPAGKGTCTTTCHGVQYWRE